MPWLLHGDGAPFSEIDSVAVISMGCAISGVTIKLAQLLLTCLPKTAMTSSSMKPLWEAIAGSFKKMADEGPGVLFVVAGDLEWFSAEFGWPTAMGNHPCHTARLTTSLTWRQASTLSQTSQGMLGGKQP